MYIRLPSQTTTRQPSDGEGIYPHHGHIYQSAMFEAQMEFDEWEKTEHVPRGITIYNRSLTERDDD